MFNNNERLINLGYIYITSLLTMINIQTKSMITFHNKLKQVVNRLIYGLYIKIKP